MKPAPPGIAAPWPWLWEVPWALRLRDVKVLAQENSVNPLVNIQKTMENHHVQWVNPV